MSTQDSIDLLLRSACRENTDKYSLAIRILKAIEAVNKSDLEYVETILEQYLFSKNTARVFIRALLESLPDAKE